MSKTIEGLEKEIRSLARTTARLQSENRKLRGPQDLVRVLRIIEYIGPRDKITTQIENSLTGTKNFGDIRITVVTLGEYPEILEKAKEVNEVDREGSDTTP